MVLLLIRVRQPECLSTVVNMVWDQDARCELPDFSRRTLTLGNEPTFISLVDSRISALISGFDLYHSGTFPMFLVQ